MGLSDLRGVFETERFVLKSLGLVEAFKITNSWRRDNEILNGLFQSARPRGIFEWYIAGPMPRTPRRFLYSITPKGETRPIGAHSYRLGGYRSLFGSVALHDRAWWGKNVVVEVRAELITQFFTHTTAERVYGLVDASNASSIFSYRKLGFSHVGTWHRHKQNPETGAIVDYVAFELFREDWIKGRYWRATDAG